MLDPGAEGDRGQRGRAEAEVGSFTPRKPTEEPLQGPRKNPTPLCFHPKSGCLAPCQ